MTLLFVGAQEIILLLFYMVVPLGLLAAFLYVVYRMVDRWVDRSVEVRRGQNALLAKLAETLDKKDKPN